MRLRPTIKTGKKWAVPDSGVGRGPKGKASTSGAEQRSGLSAKWKQNQTIMGFFLNGAEFAEFSEFTYFRESTEA